MRTLWLVVPDHVMKEAVTLYDVFLLGRIDFQRASKLYSGRDLALESAEQQSRDQGWPVHVLEATCIQVFPAEQEAAAE